VTTFVDEGAVVAERAAAVRDAASTSSSHSASRIEVVWSVIEYQQVRRLREHLAINTVRSPPELATGACARSAETGNAEVAVTWLFCGADRDGIRSFADFLATVFVRIELARAAADRKYAVFSCRASLTGRFRRD